MRTPTLLAAQILSIAFILFSVVALSAPSDARKTQPSIQITLTEQKDTAIRLEARQAPLGQILNAIAAKTGAVIHYSVLPEAPITATCAGANIGQIMDCLVAKQVGLVAHTSQKDTPAEFWLLGSSVGSCQSLTMKPAAWPRAETKQKPTPNELAKMSQMMQEQSDQLIKQAQSSDPDQRVSAIANLGSVGVKDDPSVDDALHAATQDKDATVRSQAITAIMRRGGEQISEYLAQALNDKDANVRLTAVSAIEDDIPSLQQALNDKDDAVRNMAKDKLEDIAGRQAKAE